MSKLKMNIVYFVVLLGGIVALGKMFSTRIMLNTYYLGKIPNDTVITIENRTFEIIKQVQKGKRGNIFADDSKTLLLSTVYIYDIYWNPSKVRNDSNIALFINNLDSLSILLHKINPKWTAKQYADTLKNSLNQYQEAVRKSKSKDSVVSKEGKITKAKWDSRAGILIKRSNINSQATWVRTRDIAPIDSLFKKWQGNSSFRGGFKKDIQEVRRLLKGGYPRTVLGRFYTVSDVKRRDSLAFDRGLEGYYDSLLSGELVDCKQLEVNGNVMVNLPHSKERIPHDGWDITLTLNKDIQRIARNALENQLKNCSAKWGSVVVMEVKTGEIKAIANLNRIGDRYEETSEHTIAESYEPGSTFKLITLLAALEKGVDTSDIVECEAGADGKPRYFSLKHAFAISDNQGLYHAALKKYPNLKEFVKGLKTMPLGKDLHIEIKNAGKMRMETLNKKTNVDYSNITHGYSISLPPIYMLAYYNAIANNGVYVKPRLVKSLSFSNQSPTIYETEIIDKQFCSPRVVKLAQGCLEAVVTEGSGRRGQGKFYQEAVKAGQTNVKPLIAGKTGTAFIYDNEQKKYTNIKNSSFIGYFPAEMPEYTCLVFISETTADASSIAVPVCKEIADKLVTYRKEITDGNQRKNPAEYLPSKSIGFENDISLIYKQLGCKLKIPDNAKLITVFNNGTNLAVSPNNLKTNDLNTLLEGTSARDAVYILEKRGYQTAVFGRGKVKNVSITGNKAKIELTNE
ncbi:MAG: hypothetical protein LBR36_04455 [Bacteroidales bacterium]|nr:hypothetical protein [Bacteroidales bacterium]